MLSRGTEGKVSRSIAFFRGNCKLFILLLRGAYDKAIFVDNIDLSLLFGTLALPENFTFRLLFYFRKPLGYPWVPMGEKEEEGARNVL